MITYTIFKNDTGRIYSQFSCSDMEQFVVNIPNYPDSTFVRGQYSGDDYYGSGSQVLPRPEFSINEEITLAVNEEFQISLPESTEVFVDGSLEPLVLSSLTIVSDMPAEYTLEFRKFPYKDRKVKVDVNAP